MVVFFADVELGLATLVPIGRSCDGALHAAIMPALALPRTLWMSVTRIMLHEYLTCMTTFLRTS